MFLPAVPSDRFIVFSASLDQMKGLIALTLDAKAASILGVRSRR